MIAAGMAWRWMFAPAIGTAALALMVAAGAAERAQEPAPSTVASVDLTRYAGKWYEIARIPNRFQEDCVGNAMATYRLRVDGRIDVLNECERKGGTIKKADGVAKIVDPSTNAKLKVSFVSFFGYRPFWGDYWILGLGPDYEYAVVGTPDRKYGWVLSRDPHPDPRIVEEARSVLREQGFDPDRFERSQHD